ncbi:MAG: bifunctional diaminohydroxyphosphoribosylaminopyrimidine deaminase/5-amino-6-(5-phosphoribosylamino)uracil reductase RibD [Candidatus Bipolaricaulota bacterium]|nr:bifunctional diaminohydroxyphosphoribosylaminopyrimidine deaminase/5-amino-6-(5-phosphoribosylamino)uracil reductase RibD [Candidatus Bipolaricaulota bacterium]
MNSTNPTNSTNPIDERFMRIALDLARKGEGYTNPNPIVGAVVVKDGRVIGQGYHRMFGGPHAEVFALDEAGDEAHGATLYVTLEPCSHHGKTPPCADRIIQAGISRAVIACRDPNPLVDGQGIGKMLNVGIEVTEGVLEEEARRANEIFFKFIETGLPFVQLKLAESLDGKIATRTGDAKWISGADSRTEVHRLRRRFAAILAGVNTVIHDDPLLTVRHVDGPNPVRIVIDGRGRIPLDARMLSAEGRTIVVTVRMAEEKEGNLRDRGIEVWRLPSDNSKVDLQALLSQLGEANIDSLLVEGGGETAATFLKADLIDKVAFFIAPILIGGRDAIPAIGGAGAEQVSEALHLKRIKIERIDEDLLVTGYPERGDGSIASS